MMRALLLGLVGIPALLATSVLAQSRSSPAAEKRPAPGRIEAANLKALKARSIGPAVMGGRVSDIALDPENPAVFYIGFATGGVATTTNGGATFRGIFDDQKVASIGAVAVAASNPKILWVGTGEGNDRNSSGWGDGVYRSTDGGETWTNVGLKDSKAIARIAVDPTDPDTAYVASLGNLWAAGPDRGLFKTSDGGKTWKAVLQAPTPFTNRVGCAGVVLDPSDPDTVYAALYARRRSPWSFTYGPEATDGKDLGGIFKSSDSGATWKKLEKGLPSKLGNIGFDVSRSNPKILLAVVQSDEGGQGGIDDLKSRAGGIFRSEDAGESWRRVNALDPRPFYFTTIRIDPSDPERVYVLGFALHVSDDGGKTFREDLSEKIHPDLHAMAIDPKHPKRLLLGTDGGAYQSWDGAKSWEHLNRVAAGQFYRISLDSSTPYRICGGLQDNLNWVGPSRTRTKEGILHSDWITLGGGDGFYCVFDPDDANVLYTESQAGEVFRFDLGSGQDKRLRPEPAEGQPAFRFQWNSPLIGSRHEKGAMYLAGNRVFKLTAKGERWSPISPDLSTQDPKKTTAVGSGAENYGVVYTLAESPVKKGLLWAGTDDGKLWVTENEGESWTDLTAHLPAAAKELWMARIEPSFHDPRVAYLAVETHRSNRYEALAFRTDDLGKTWKSVAGDLPASGPVKVLREDPKNPDLLFAGTEFGLFVSLDQGKRWLPFGGIPTVAVDDIQVHPGDRDLVVATHGRSLWIVDDISPLEELSPETAQREAHLFPPRPAHGFHLLKGFADWNGKAVFRGENPKEGAILTFWVREFSGDEASIEIVNASDQPVAKIKGPATPGLNRVFWDLKPSKELMVEYGGLGPLLVRAGEYTVKLKVGKAKSEQKLQVTLAPGVETR
jgi:photosystem II stability/assembly factor-like uncharacterized protein